MVHRPGQRQSISAASAVNAKGAFWFCTYEGALNAELFVELLQEMMQYRKKPVHLVWSHVKRTGTARRPLQKGEKLRERIEEQLAKLQKLPRLVRSFFQALSVAYIGGC